MRREEAEARLKARVEESLRKFCPLIRDYCRADCVFFEKPHVFQGGNKNAADNWGYGGGICNIQVTVWRGD